MHAKLFDLYQYGRCYLADCISYQACFQRLLSTTYQAVARVYIVECKLLAITSCDNNTVHSSAITKEWMVFTKCIPHDLHAEKVVGDYLITAVPLVTHKYAPWPNEVVSKHKFVMLCLTSRATNHFTILPL